MNLELRSLEKAAGQLRLAQSVQVSPTIVIGLGGSGTYTVRRLKRLMELRYGLPPLVQFLYIDCDQDAFAPKPELANVQDAERVDLRLQNPEQILDDARKGIGQFGMMKDWIPDGLSVSILRNAIGAGGIRPVGRFAFFVHLAEFEQRFQSALNNSLAIEQQLATLLGELAGKITVDTNQLRLYIVGSLCGGTGSSLFLDVAILARHIIKQQAPNASTSIVGIFYLPSVFQNEPGIRTNRSLFDLICANAYAGLMELEYFCDESVLQKEPFTFRYPNFGPITVNSAVYDEDFVIESFTPDGRCLLSKEEVFEMVARSLLVDIGSPVGARIRTANANIATVLKMKPCPQTNKPRLIHSLGTTAVAVPVWELLKRGAFKILQQFLQDKGLGSAIKASELDNEVNIFLQSNHLDERGERNDLLEALLRKGDGNQASQVSYKPARSREELEREAGGSDVQQAQYVANWVENELNRIRIQVVPEAQGVVNERKIEVLRTAVGAVAGRLETLTKTNGLRAAQSFVGQLIAVFETVCDELANEQKKYETEQKQALENIINNQVAFLRSLQGIWGSVKALGRVDEQAMDTALQTLREYGDAEILRVARQAAIELIGSEQPIDGHQSLLKQLRAWQQQIERAIVKVNDLIKLLTQEISHRIQTTPTGSTYTLEQWVITPSEFNDWLKQIGITDTSYDADALWQALGGNLEERLKELTETKAEDLLDKLAARLVDSLSEKLQGWDILRVIEEKRKTDEKQRIDAILRTMMQVCQPFWSAPRHAPGGADYQTFMAYTAPTAEGDERFQETRKVVEQLANESGYRPEIVYSGYPFVLEMVVRVYGARGFYLNSTRSLRYQYEQKRQNQETAQMLHLDRRFLDFLPTLHEHERKQS